MAVGCSWLDSCMCAIMLAQGRGCMGAMCMCSDCSWSCTMGESSFTGRVILGSACTKDGPSRHQTAPHLHATAQPPTPVLVPWNVSCTTAP